MRISASRSRFARREAIRIVSGGFAAGLFGASLAPGALAQTHANGEYRRIVMVWAINVDYLAILLERPLAHLVGWTWPATVDEQLLSLLRQLSPGHDVEVVGRDFTDFNLEAVLSLNPDVVVLPTGSADWKRVADLLERSGVRSVFLDKADESAISAEQFVADSVITIGRVLGAERKAQQYVEFYSARYQRIVRRIESISVRPKVLFEAHAGGPCCFSYGRGAGFRDPIDLLAGRNIGHEVIPGAIGTMSAEYIVATDPDIYIGTGSSHQGLALGFGRSRDEAQESLKAAVARTGFPQLNAVREGRAYGISHALMISPLNIVVLEAIAKWLHPEHFRDVNPRETLDEIGERFFAVPLEGAFWIGLGEDDFAGASR